MTERFDEVELLRLQKLEAELDAAKVRAESKMGELQRAIDVTWARHGLTKGVDYVNADGTFVRTKKEGE